jgi:uncharacterized membrane protein YdbT with pleckstrin-like domain
MSYTVQTLQPGEQVKKIVDRHWIIYAPSALWTACGVVALIAIPPVGAIALLLGLLALFFVWFKNVNTEIAVTDRRVVYKTGWIARQTLEINTAKVESVLVNQSMMGRLLGYGTLDVKGVGQSIEDLRPIVGPLAIRAAILG